MKEVEPDQSASKLHWKRWLLLLLAALVAAVGILPPLVNINRYQHRIAESISRAIGRPVHMSQVRLRLLPRPGFQIENFEVEEDPAFGEEPMLRSASVVASLRLASLWRGRLEVARINFDEPSLNIVRDAGGRWSFDSLLVKAAQGGVAPTEQPHAGAAPRFPYLDVSNGRINFKQGAEKTPFSLLNADVTVSLDRPGMWRLHFEAQPVRTDINLSLADTGIVRLDGTFQRAAETRLVPLALKVEWTGAPLGQFSRLLTGSDMGWRGDLDLRAEVSGTPEDAIIKSRMRVRGIHRAEFAPQQPLDLDASCTAAYQHAGHSLDEIDCIAPIGDGRLLLNGSLRSIGPGAQPNLTLRLGKVPVAAALDSLRSLRNDFAPRLQAAGTIDGEFHLDGADPAAPAVVDGKAAISALSISAPELDEPITLPVAQLSTAAVQPVAKPAPRSGKSTAPKNRKALAPAPLPGQTALVLAPVAMAAGGPAPLVVDGRFTPAGFVVHMSGAASVKKLDAFGSAFGLLSGSVSPLAPRGSAEMDLALSGPWLLPVGEAGTTADRRDGWLQLHDTGFAPPFLASPVEVVSARALFSGNDVVWDPVQVEYAGLRATAGLRYTAPCADEEGCVPGFHLRFTTLDAATAEAAILGGRRQLLAELLSRMDRRPHPWPKLNGTVEVGTLSLGPLVLRDVSAAIAVDGSTTQIQSLEGRALGGTLDANGTLDVTSGSPRYKIKARVHGANTAEAAALFREKWGGGVLNADASLDLAGYTTDDLTSSAAGVYRFEWTRGGLAAGEGILGRFDRWTAEGALASKSLELAKSELVRGNEIVLVTGTISTDRDLDLTMTAHGAPVESVGGTLERPQVAPAGGTRVARRSSRSGP